jgi:hypothetical protein
MGNISEVLTASIIRAMSMLCAMNKIYRNQSDKAKPQPEPWEKWAGMGEGQGAREPTREDGVPQPSQEIKSKREVD